MRPNIPSNYQIKIVDLADFDLATSEGENQTISPYGPEPEVPRKSAAQWQDEISQHSGIILLFPYHVWSYTNPLKYALSLLPSHTLTKKPTLLLGFGKEEPFHPPGYVRTWQRKSFGMMKEFVEEKMMKSMLTDPEMMPEFEFYANYWDDWYTGGWNGCIGGQQSEAWENRAWNRCQKGIKLMVEEIEKRKR